METVGTYRLVGKLGEGGMGVVYVGEHALLGRRAAIKILRPEMSANRDVVVRFFNEAKAVTQITDPGIVQVFDFGYATDGSAYIIMELLDGEAMDKRLRRIGRFSPIDAVRILRLIAHSLSAAHGKGIVHRDLKPENVILIGDPAVTGGERPKILDFGIAKLSGDEAGVMRTSTGVVMGTPLYMSPEQCQGAGIVDHRSDIYSLGCVAMTMLTGQPPFAGSGSGDLIVAHMTKAPPRASERVPGMPRSIEDLLQRCLAKEPAQRFASMTELATALSSAERELASGIAGPRPSTPALPFGASTPTTLTNAASQHIAAGGSARRSRAGMFVGIGATLGIAIGAVAFVATRDDGTRKAAAPAATPGASADEAPVAPAPVQPAPVQAAPVQPSPPPEVPAQPAPTTEVATPAPAPEPPASAPPPATTEPVAKPTESTTAKKSTASTSTTKKTRTKTKSKTNERQGTPSTTSVDRGD